MPKKTEPKDTQSTQPEQVQQVRISDIHPFKNHPFKVVDDALMQETVDSIMQFGVLNPTIIRPDPGGGYEMVAGHRRLHASGLAGKDTIPAIVRNLTDDEAVILLVDTNLQRENISPIGGFPELVLSDDDMYAQRMLREDVVDKVIKRDVLTLFNIRSPLLMEKLFLYLCMNSTEIFSVTTAAKELENTSAATIDSYIEALEMSNLIYLSKPMDVGSKGALKGKPKIYIADAAIRNAVLMIDDVLSDERELGAMVETTVYKHIVSFYQGSTAQLGYFRKAKDNQKEVDVVIELPREKILCEVKYRNNSHIPATDAIVELCKDESAKVTSAFLITKQLDDFGIAKHETQVPILRVPAIAFLYLLGKAEADGQNGKM